MVNCHSEPRIAEAIASIRADSPPARLDTEPFERFLEVDVSRETLAPTRRSLLRRST
jgi:hypothetical protein